MQETILFYGPKIKVSFVERVEMQRRRFEEFRDRLSRRHAEEMLYISKKTH